MVAVAVVVAPMIAAVWGGLNGVTCHSLLQYRRDVIYNSLEKGFVTESTYEKPIGIVRLVDDNVALLGLGGLLRKIRQHRS